MNGLAVDDQVEWYLDDESGQYRARLRDRDDVVVGWAPQPGSQEAFLSCPVTECLIEGSRGGGKTDALLMDFAQFCGRGYGQAWRGILFRRKFTELKDVLEKAQRWYPNLFPGVTYNESKHEWRWPGGESLLFSYLERPQDFQNYKGHEYPWIGWEELTTWANDSVYKLMFSCNRSSVLPRYDPERGIPNLRRVRATTNPYGRGHNWVKARFELPLPPGQIVGPIIHSVDDKGKRLPDRVAIHSMLNENRVLVESDPDYEAKMADAARNPEEKKAWREGSWDIVSGGMFDDLWNPLYHVFGRPGVGFLPSIVPAGWRLDRAYDDGQSKPFSVGWWAQSNGEPLKWNEWSLGPIRGDLLRVQEWYGWTGKENVGVKLSSRDIAKGIIDREEKWNIHTRVRPGPADSAIWSSDPRDPGASVAKEMARKPFQVYWEPAHKGPGSRIQGWKTVRDYLKGAIPVSLAPGEPGRRESPGLFVSWDCRQFLRTFPTLSRDEKEPDDVDTEMEDHIADETRYRCRRPRVVEQSQSHLVY